MRVKARDKNESGVARQVETPLSALGPYVKAAYIPNQLTPEGCVAKIDGSLVEVVFVLIIACQAHLVHEPQAPFQVASLPIRAHPVVRPVVLTLPA